MSILQKARNKRLGGENVTAPAAKDQPTKGGALPLVPSTREVAPLQTPIKKTATTRPSFVPRRTLSLKPSRREPLVPQDEKAFDVRTDVRRGRPGRRTAVPGTKRNRKITLNLSSLEYVAIVQAAEDQGISVSTLGRLAVFDAYGVPRPHPEKVLTVAQKRKAAKKAPTKKGKRAKA